MKRITIGLVLLAFLAAPLHAQGEKEKKNEDNELLRQYLQRKKENAEVDKQYQKTLQRTRGADSAPVKVDPWANMRGTDAGKPKQ
jgi:hypothetical protein